MFSKKSERAFRCREGSGRAMMMHFETSIVMGKRLFNAGGHLFPDATRTELERTVVVIFLKASIFVEDDSIVSEREKESRRPCSRIINWKLISKLCRKQK